MFQMQDLLSDPDYSQQFTILRNTGLWVAGKWTNSAPIVSVAPNASNLGLGYAVNNVVTIVQGNASAGTFKVTTIGLGGTVTGLSLLTSGIGYYVGTGNATTTNSVHGSGLQVDITAVAPFAASIPIVGVIVPSTPEEIQMVPEGDRVGGMLSFFSPVKLDITSVANSGLPDQILWHGDYYKLISVTDYSDFGFWAAIGVRITGD